MKYSVTYVDVHFACPAKGGNDITVTHTPSPIVSSSDYFAFGLQHTTGERAGVYEQRTLFQSQELQDELNIRWVQFKWRNHDPGIGRFFNVDPIAEKYYYNSTYAFSENKVTAHIELEGLEAWDIKYSDGSARKVYGPFKDQNAAETFADDQLIISPVKDPKITSGISSARLDPVTQDKIRPHTGVDIVKSEGPTGGAKVSAPLNGKISEKGSDSGRGNYVHLTANKDSKIHRFYHMQDGSTDNVKTGDNISRGGKWLGILTGCNYRLRF